jgi:hypothetical protein
MPRKPRSGAGRITLKAKQYVRGNWGAPFIIAFMALLIVCAGTLAYGNEALANEVAVYAYYSLVAGVVLQLAAFIRDERRKGKAEAKPDSHDCQS